MNTQNKRALIITGPTGVGKTDLSLALAQEMPVEIINADVGQFYEPLTIGTAKPNWRQLSTPHHLFDILREPRHFTVAEYRQRVALAVSEIFERKHVPVIVGGSLFYIKSLFFPTRNPTHDITKDFEAEVDVDICDTFSLLTTADLWKQLYEIDPDSAQAIAKNDAYRLRRALDIWRRFGIRPSELAPQYDPIAPCTLVYVTRDRQDLNQRIDRRTAYMIEHGWLDEVTSFAGTEWEPFLRRKKLIGYPDILRFLNGRQTKQEYEDLVAHIALSTRQYAKRQATFWRSLERSLKAEVDSEKRSVCIQANLTLSTHDLYIKQLMSLYKTVDF